MIPFKTFRWSEIFIPSSYIVHELLLQVHSIWGALHSIKLSKRFSQRPFAVDISNIFVKQFLAKHIHIVLVTLAFRSSYSLLLILDFIESFLDSFTHYLTFKALYNLDWINTSRLVLATSQNQCSSQISPHQTLKDWKLISWHLVLHF